MEEMKRTLTGSEWLLMSALWGREPQILSEIINSLEGKVDWGYPTYSTHLNRLSKKGLVGFHQRGRNKYYYPLVEMDDCVRAESRSLKERMSEEGAKKLLLCMIRETKLSKDEQEELKSLIDTLAETAEEE